MTFSRTKAWLLTGMLLLVAAGWWAMENIEFEEVTYPGVPKGEAVRNNLFAVQRMAARMGASASYQFGFAGLPPAGTQDSVVVIPTQRRTMTARQREALLAWVSAGGHLITVTYTLDREGDRPDTLLREVGVYQTLTPAGRAAAAVRDKLADDPEGAPDDEAKRKARESERRREAEKSMEKLRRQFPMLPRSRDNCPALVVEGAAIPRTGGTATSMKVCFDNHFQVESRRPMLWSVRSEQGTHALTVAHGAGRVTVLTDYDFMTNARIGAADHADMAATLLGLYDARPVRQILFIPREDAEGILRLTWKYAAPVVIALLAWLLLALWRAGIRFGPMQPPSPAARRSLAEHVRASGEYLWRHGQSPRLWRATLDLARDRIERTLPAASFANAQAQLQALAQRSGIDAGHLEEILHAAHPPAPDTFATTIATLNQLRKSL